MNVKELLTPAQIKTLISIYWQPTEQRKWNQRRGIKDHSSPIQATDPSSAFNYLKVVCLLSDQEALTILEKLIISQFQPQNLDNLKTTKQVKEKDLKPDVQTKLLHQEANLQTQVVFLKKKVSEQKEKYAQLKTENTTLKQKLNQYNELATVPSPISPIEFKSTPLGYRRPNPQLESR